MTLELIEKKMVRFVVSEVNTNPDGKVQPKLELKIAYLTKVTVLNTDQPYISSYLEKPTKIR